MGICLCEHRILSPQQVVQNQISLKLCVVEVTRFCHGDKDSPKILQYTKQFVAANCRPCDVLLLHVPYYVLIYNHKHKHNHCVITEE